MKRDKSEHAAQIYAQQRNAATLRQMLGEGHPHVRKLTLSTVLAQATEKVEQNSLHSMLSTQKSSMNLEKESDLLEGLLITQST